MMDAERDTEITLGAGKLLGLFFGLVVLCAAFFGIGFSLGKNSISGAAANVIPDTATSTGAKSSASSGAVAPEPAPAASEPAANATETQSQPTVEPVAATTSQPAASPVAPAPPPAIPAANPPNRTTPGTTNTAGAANAAAGGYLVQVAAVTKKEDAEALVAALKRKQYAAFMALNPLDSFFHVQIGPFADSKQADALKARLVSDGYSPIVKR